MGEPKQFVIETRRHAAQLAGGSNALTASFYSHIVEVCEGLLASRR